MSTKHLPKGYEPVKKIDLLENHNEMLIVNMLSFFLMAVLIVIGGMYYGVDALRQLILAKDNDDVKQFFTKLALTLILCAAYIVLHECVHALFMKIFYPQCKVNFGYKVIYAFAGSDSFFSRGAYIVIAGAPLVILGSLLLIICILVPNEWFWPVYLVQVMNVSGAAGDIYVFFIIVRMSKDILIRDTGVAATVYGKCE